MLHEFLPLRVQRMIRYSSGRPSARSYAMFNSAQIGEHSSSPVTLRCLRVLAESLYAECHGEALSPQLAEIFRRYGLMPSREYASC